jgi:hypothetical protein
VKVEFDPSYSKMQNLKEYNNTKRISNSTIGMKPAEVNKNNEKLTFDKVFDPKSVEDIKFIFKVGNFVRISKLKGLFEKGYIANWSTEVQSDQKESKSEQALQIIGNVVAESYANKRSMRGRRQFVVSKVTL